jgi:putative transposase
VIHHSDQIGNCTSPPFAEVATSPACDPQWISRRLLRHCLCEGFFATLECELLDQRSLKTEVEARIAGFDFVKGWYNPSLRGYEINL